MPRLSHPLVTQIEAIKILIRVYFTDENFAKDFNKVVHPFVPICERFATKILIQSKEKQSALNMEDCRPELEEFKNSVTEFLWRWRLKSSYAVFHVLYGMVFSVLPAKGIRMPYQGISIPYSQDIPPENVPLEQLASLPIEPFVPNLEITVPAAALIFWGRERVSAEIAKRLQNYENKVKAAGFKENPSGLEEHARWWFEHYVHMKKYSLLAKEFPSSKSAYSGVNREESIKRAVSKFSKLIEVNMKG